DEIEHLVMCDLHALDARRIRAQCLVGAIELGIPLGSGSPMEVAQPEPMRRAEPTGAQCVEVVVLKDRATAGEAQHRIAADSVPETVRGRDEPCAVVVDRPAEAVADDVELGAAHDFRTSRYRSATSASEGTRIAARHRSSSSRRRPSAAGTSSAASKPTPASPPGSGGPPLRRETAGTPHTSAPSNPL